MTDDDTVKVQMHGDHIYFYTDVDSESALAINTMINAFAADNKYKPDRATLHIHINSRGGDLYAGVSIADTILNCKKDVDINTYVEGLSASAASLISICGTKRFMTFHSVMLIHELYGGTINKYSKMVEDVEGFGVLMEAIKDIYLGNTKIKKSKLEEILKHDVYWRTDKCLAMGLIDEVV